MTDENTGGILGAEGTGWIHSSGGQTPNDGVLDGELNPEFASEARS
jgi:hypothetical protein